MELRQLRHFLALVEERSITRAVCPAKAPSGAPARSRLPQPGAGRPSPAGPGWGGWLDLASG